MRQPQEISFTSPKMLRSWVVGLTSLIVLTACSATAADATQPTAKRVMREAAAGLPPGCRPIRAQRHKIGPSRSRQAGRVSSRLPR